MLRDTTPAVRKAWPITGPDAPFKSVRSRSKNAAPAIPRRYLQRSRPPSDRGRTSCSPTKPQERRPGGRPALWKCVGSEGGFRLRHADEGTRGRVRPLVWVNLRVGNRSVKQLSLIGAIMESDGPAPARRP